MKEQDKKTQTHKKTPQSGHEDLLITDAGRFIDISKGPRVMTKEEFEAKIARMKKPKR